MAATNFCEVYDCRTTEFFRIDRFSTEDQYNFSIGGGNTGEGGSMIYYLDYGWYGSITDAEIFPGHGIRFDIDDDGVYDTDSYKLSYMATTLENQEFCHPGLGCTGFGNGTGIILPHRDMNDPLVPITVDIPIPLQISEDGDPIYSEDQDEFFGDGGGGDTDCFIAGTKILLSDNSYKNIEDINTNDVVKSYNIETKKIEDKKVNYIYDTIHSGKKNDYTIIVSFKDIENHNTFTNPYWVVGKGWCSYNPIQTYKKYKIKVKQLEIGDVCLIYKDGVLVANKILNIEEVFDEIHTYNFHVDGNHNYFANNILVHNKHGGSHDDDNEGFDDLYGCFTPGADNFQECPPNTNCIQPFPPSENACKWNGEFHSDELDGGNDDGGDQAVGGEIRCCIPGTQDGTVVLSGKNIFEPGGTLKDNNSQIIYEKGNHEDNVGNVLNTEACNQVDCSVQDFMTYNDNGTDVEILVPKFHFDGQCVNSMGTHGKFGHNIVFDYYFDTVFRNFDYDEEGEGDITDPSLYHYPFVQTRVGFDEDEDDFNNAIEYITDEFHTQRLDIDFHRYFDPPPTEHLFDSDWNDNDINSDELQNGILNPVFDRWQVGTDASGQELYNLPIYKNLTCQEVEDLNGITLDQYNGTRTDVELGIGLSKSPYESGIVPDSNQQDDHYYIGDSHTDGIDYCGGSDLVDEAFNLLFDNPLYFNVIVNILVSQPTEIWFQDIDENITIPNNVDGYGLNSSGVSNDIIGDDSIEYIQNEFVDDDNLNRDVLIRIGFPLPPIAFNQEGCGGVSESYLKLVEEFIGEVELLTFFGDFEIPNVEIEPTMKNELDVLSGIDLRPDVLDACSHIEFMTFPGGNANGDGIYYKGMDIPSIYFTYAGNTGDIDDGSMTVEEYVRTFDCNTELNNDIQFSQMRAVCKDGSSILMGQAGADGNESNYLQHGTTDEFFNTGLEACNSLLKLNSSQDLYYLSDNDGKESLGIFFFDSQNRTSENFVNNIDESYEQYPLLNNVRNGSGKDVAYRYTSDSFINRGWGQVYRALGWKPIQSEILQSTGGEKDFRHVDNHWSTFIGPYWRAEYQECFSFQKCIVVDTLKPIQTQGTDDPIRYDPRQGIATFVSADGQSQNFPEVSGPAISQNLKRRKQKFKLSFMMKTIDLDDGVDLKNTGINIGLEFNDDGSYPSFNDSEPERHGAKPYKTSQCSENGKNPNHYSANLTTFKYCNETRASFTNTKMNEWQKMEYVFEVTKDYNFKTFPFMKIIIAPLQFGKMDHNFWTSHNVYDDNEGNDGYDGGIFDTYMRENASVILVDNVEFKEAYDFHPDVDVRKKKGPNDYGLVSLMEYYDRFKPTANIEEFNDTTAPLEVQFYFYPRFPYDNTLSPNREILLEEFNAEQFYILGIDWGDGSSIDFEDDPKKISPTEAIYHTYEQSGIYEIKGTMFVTVAETYNYSSNPRDVDYIGNIGIGYNKRFSVKININEGPDEDFTYFGADGFSFIPYKDTTPIIGGYSKESIYYKSIRRNLGIVDSDSSVELVDVNYSRTSDRLKAESAFQKMDSSYNDTEVLELLNYYQQPINIAENTTDEYLATLPFPRYFQEFDITGAGGTPDNQLSPDDVNRWIFEGRPDIAEVVTDNLTNGGAEVGVVGIHNITSNFNITLSIPFINDGQFDSMPPNYEAAEELLLELGLSTEACAKVFGGNGDFNGGDYVITQAIGSAIDNDSREWTIFQCIQSTLNEFGNTLPVLSESDTYNPPETYVNPTIQRQTEQYTGEQYKTAVEQLGESIGDVDLSNPKYHNTSKAMWEILGFQQPNSDDYDILLGPELITNGDFTAEEPPIFVTWDYGEDNLKTGIITGWDLYSDIYVLDDIRLVNESAVIPNTGGDTIEFDFNALRMYQDTNPSNRMLYPITNESIVQHGKKYLVRIEIMFTSETHFDNNNRDVVLELEDGSNQVILSGGVFANEPYMNEFEWDVEFTDESSSGKVLIRQLYQNGHQGFYLKSISIKEIQTPTQLHPGNPESIRYWKNIIPEDYSIYRRQGINFSPPTQLKEFYELDEVLGAQYFSFTNISNDVELSSSEIITLMGHLIVDENDTNGHSKYDRGIEAYAGGDIYDVNPSGDWSCGGNQNPNEDGCFNIDKIYPQVNYIVTFLSLPNVTFDVEYCHPLFGCTGFGKGEGIMFKGPYTMEPEEYELFIQNNYVGIYNAPSDFKLEFKLSSLAIDIYSQQEWLDNYYYPVLPRYDSSGKFIEGDFPNDNIPFPTEGIITNDEQDGESLSISLTSETIDTNVFNDESGQQNKGFTVNDFKPKFENDTLEIKKTKKMNPIKKSNKNRAF